MRAALARNARRALRLPLLLVHITIGVAIATALPHPRRAVASPRASLIWNRVLCRILGLRVRVRGVSHRRATLFVANHISWLDIVCIASVCPTFFLAKREVRDWPVCGWLAWRAGTLFIRRGEPNAAAEASAQIAWRLRRGSSVLIFPEGTSTAGHGVKHFYPRLFQAALYTGSPVQPAALRYPHPVGVNPVAPFIDDDNLLRHAWRLLGERCVPVEVHFGCVVESAGHSRDALAAITRGQIAAVIATAAVEQETKTATAWS
ncbi:MAG: lysophospholipid acyltransferase family protein [Gammaproteobacteria bacterium]